MNKCPFIAVRQVTREVRVDADGKVLEQKETPAVELRECLGAECEVFDAAAGKCSVPAIDARILRLEELQRAVQEDASHALLAEVRETRENTAATMIHVLRKIDAANELLGRQSAASGGGTGDLSALLAPLTEMKENLANSQTKFSDILELMLEDQQKRALESHTAASGAAAPAGPAAVDLAPLQASLGEMKEALATSNAKFTDILELMLEDQQKRALASHTAASGAAAPAGPAAVDLAPLQASLGEMKEALATSNGKFSDILELMLEEQQRKAGDGATLATALEQLAQKQEQMFGALAQQLQPSGGQDWQRELKGDLAGMAGMIEQGIARISDAEAKRQSAVDTSASRLAELQQSMLALLEAQRAEQGAAGVERIRRESEEHNEKGVMLYHRRELGAAEAEFRRALELRPDFAEAFNNIGLVLSDQGKREDAVAAFRRALELMPDAPETYNNLGCLFKAKKDYQQAVEYFNQAIAKRADYSPGYFNLGLAYEEMEKFDQAIKAWDKVLTLQPTHDEARRKIATYRARKA